MDEISDKRHYLSTLLLDVDDLAHVLDDVGLDVFMDQLIDRLRQDIGGFDPAVVETQVRKGFNYSEPETGLVEWMPTMIAGDVVAVKTVGYHPANPIRRGLPSVLASTALYDTSTGGLVALSEATLLTALRTGAASAVVTAAVTANKPIRLGVVGCGAQAVSQIHAISRVRPIDSIIVTDIDPSVAATLGDRLPLGIPLPEVHDSASFNGLVGSLDVLVTATSVPQGAGPVVDLSGAGDHLHINAVGADFPGKRELPIDYVRAAVVIADDVEQCLIEGESQGLSRVELGPDMVEVLGRDWEALHGQQTIFDSTGWAYEDLIVSTLFMAHAVRLDRGRVVELQRAPKDPFDPYETIRSTNALRAQPVDQTLRDLG